MSRKTYTPAELRKFANSPFWHDEARAALAYCADVIESANAAIAAEWAEVKRLRAQLEAKDGSANV